LISLPDRNQFSVNQFGIVQISPLLTLTNMLCAPSF